MKKVLIIVPFWPYRPGSRRTIGLAKYLPEFGWQPIILTPPLYLKPDSRFRVIETPYHDVLGFWKRLFRLNQDENLRIRVKKQFSVTSKRSLVDLIFSLGGEIINYPDIDKGWQPFAIKAGTQLLQNESIEAMISISPATRHLIAKALKIRYKIPWIADFPDLWSQNHAYHYSPLRRALDRRLERKTLSRADALVTVSEPWAEKLRTLHKGKPVYAITHGFDPEEVNIPPAKLTAKFTITYTGTIYTGKQDPTKLFTALKNFISDGTMNPQDIEVRFYGTGVVWLEREINRYGLSNVVKHYERLPKGVAVGKQRESQLLLLLRWEDPQEHGWHSGKLYEYLAARRPILATGGAKDVIQELMEETGAGICTATIEEMKRTLQKLYQEYKLKGKVAYSGIESKINKYSHQEVARKFAEILDSLISK